MTKDHRNARLWFATMAGLLVTLGTTLAFWGVRNLGTDNQLGPSPKMGPMNSGYAIFCAVLCYAFAAACFYQAVKKAKPN